MKILGWKTDVAVAVLAGFLVTFATESATHLAKRWFSNKPDDLDPESQEEEI